MGKMAMSDLPKGWIKSKLGDIVHIKYGKDLSTKKILSKGKYPVFGANSIIGYYDEYLYETEQVLISCRGANSGKINFSPPKCFVTHNSLVLEFGKDFFAAKKYLFYALQAVGKSTIITGSAQPQVTINNAINLEISLAPLNEQRRIVAKLEKLLHRVDACKERLNKIPAILKRFRQSVLAAACSGRLTADWREKNPDVAPKCYSERSEESRFRSNDETRFAQGDNDEDQLPESWIVTALENLCEGFQYGTSAKSQKSGKVPVLRMGNIQNGKIDWTDLAYTSDEDEINKFILRKGDVLFNRTNSPELVGKTGIYKGERPAIFAGYLIRIKNYPELNSEYLNYCLNTVYAREFCQQVKTDGVSQSNVNAQKLGKFPLPLSPNNTK